MTIAAVIPARMGSSRFPGKPLAPILGRPMLQWVFEGARRCPRLAGVWIATCDDEIRRLAEGLGAPVLMTSPRHERASDRVAEAAVSLPDEVDVIVMVQGDEPMVTPDFIACAIEPFVDPAVLCTNLAAPVTTEAEFHDPNAVKVVVDRHGDALYYSREPIPSRAQIGSLGGPAYRQVCVIGFRRSFLRRFAQIEPTRLEILESIDMLRALEHGYPVRIVPIAEPSHPVDTPADLAVVERLLTDAARS